MKASFPLRIHKFFLVVGDTWLEINNRSTQTVAARLMMLRWSVSLDFFFAHDADAYLMSLDYESINGRFKINAI